MIADELFENAITRWRNNKGVGTAIIPYPMNDEVMVQGVLQRIYARSPTCKTVILTSTFKERQNLTSVLTTKDCDENNAEFTKLLRDEVIKILSFDYIEKCSFTENVTLVIIYRPNLLSNAILEFMRKAKFKLVILNKLLSDSKTMTALYKDAPIFFEVTQKNIEEIKLSTPVEECRIGVSIPANSEERRLLDSYTEYISTSLNIFGSFDVMQQANSGNAALNISSYQICNTIAKENGWNENLDMSVEFNLEIDRLYNPSRLKERAYQTYEIIRNRGKLLANYKGKLNAILDIIKENADKKILIINKYGDFAKDVTDYINSNSDKVICMNFHDKVDNIPAVDNNGNPILYKSGAKKGKPKMMGVQSQKTHALQKFHNNEINILSTNNTPDKILDITVDILIITSPMCEDLRTYIYRLSDIRFSDNEIHLYSIYCKETQEERQLENKSLMRNHTVKSSYRDDNISNFLIVD